MSSPRILVVSDDATFGQRIVDALGPLAPAELHPSPEVLAEPDGGVLGVLHLGGELADRARAEDALRAKGPPVLAILPRADLATVVAWMESSPRIVGVLVAEGFDPSRLVGLATRALASDRFGLARILAPGTEIHTATVGDFEEKTRAMASISELAARVGASTRHQAAIEQCADELLMNALYDAPVDADGEPLFAGIPARERITMRTEQRVAVQYAHDGKRLAIAVCDVFGGLQRTTVLRHLYKCLHAREQIDRKAGGAGVGLFLIVSSASEVHFNVVPKIATEVVCVFDVASPTVELAQLSFSLQTDAAGRVGAGPARRISASRPRPRSLRTRVLGGALGVVAIVLGVVVGPRLAGSSDDDKARVAITTVPAGASIELDGKPVGVTTGGALSVGGLDPGRAYPVIVRLDGHETQQTVLRPDPGTNAVRFELRALAIVELSSEPPGATVEIDGAPVGSTPLRLTTLAPGSTVELAFARPGYRRVTSRLEVPRGGQTTRHVQPLERSEAFVRVRFASSPPGAEIVRTGDASTIDRTFTPAEVFVEAGQEHRFTLRMPGYEPLALEPFTPAPGSGDLEMSGTLVREPSR